MQSSRVPAWKKLGLKLKNANDEPISNGNVAREKVSQTADYQDWPLSRKRRRLDLSGDAGFSTASDSQLNGVKPQKRVSFSPDTKSENEVVQVETTNNFLSSSSKSKPRKTAKSKAKNRQRNNDIIKKSETALEYLEQYYNDRGTWKFNKNREVWIFKHLTSTKDLPQSYNLALSHYLHGIQSQNTKSRLINQLQESTIREDDTEGSDGVIPINDEGQRQKFLQNLTLIDHKTRNESEENEEYRNWIKSQKREHVLLWSLDAPLIPIEQNRSQKDSSNDVSTETKQSKRKQPKIRTNVMTFSSSSSSSSSSSGGSDDDDESDTTSSSGEDEDELTSSEDYSESDQNDKQKHDDDNEIRNGNSTSITTQEHINGLSEGKKEDQSSESTSDEDTSSE